MVDVQTEEAQMPRGRSSMRRIREVLRLRWEAQLSQREIGISCRLGRSTVRGCLVRAGGGGAELAAALMGLRDW